MDALGNWRETLSQYGRAGADYLRRLGLGDLRAPSDDAQGLIPPPNFDAISRDARDFESLIKHPGWIKLLDRLEHEANLALGRLRECKSDDPVIIKGFRDRWAQAEAVIRTIESIAVQAVALRDAILADLAVKYGGASEVDAAAGDIKDISQMRAQLKREGVGGKIVSINHEELFQELGDQPDQEV